MVGTWRVVATARRGAGATGRSASASSACCSIAVAPARGPHREVRSTDPYRTSMPINAESGNHVSGKLLRQPCEIVLHQAAVAGPAGQLVTAGELELAQHRGDVGLDRLHRQVQAPRDLLVGEAAGDVAQDLTPP